MTTLSTLIDELRAVGVGVSVGEHLDAAKALASVPLSDLDVVRASLQCALVKRAEHLDAFNLLFDLHFSETGQSQRPSLSELADADLAAALRAAVESGEGLRELAEEYVRRFGGLQPGAPVAGVFAMIGASQAADLDGLRDEIIAAGESGGGTGGGGGGLGAVQARLDRASADRAVGGFRTELQSAIRRALVADRGASAVSRTMRIRLAEDVSIANASAAEQEAMLASIGPLAQRLSKILAQQLYRKRRLSVRRTLHLAIGTGGVPFRLATEPAPPPRPDFVVLADVSGSVASFSRFTLNLLIALDSRLSRLRAFSFVDGLAEITELVSEARAAGRQLGQAEAAQGAIRRSGSSDYGPVLREFAGCAREFSKRTVVLVVGDARTNYGDPAVAALAEISERVGKLYWLNPEPRRYWDQGDSVISRYAPHCAQVRECSTLRQIAEFVQSLAS